MQNEPIPLCQCGAPGVPLEIQLKGTPVALGTACQACFDQAQEEFKGLQKDFQELLAQGVHRRIADRIMCERINSGYYGATKPIVAPPET
jgi:hypothetical protein